MKTRTLLIPMFILSCLLSCDKDRQVYTEEEDSSKISLSDFLASTTDEDISLMGKNVIDNSRSTSFKSKKSSLRASVPLEVEEEAGIGIKFKWHGTDPRTHGCIKPLGICITFGYEDVQSISPEEVNADVYILDGNKLVIHPRTEENGLTSDGYLPVGNYVPFGDNLLIKPGIYKGTPNEIIVDLVEL